MIAGNVWAYNISKTVTSTSGKGGAGCRFMPGDSQVGEGKEEILSIFYWLRTANGSCLLVDLFSNLVVEADKLGL